MARLPARPLFGRSAGRTRPTLRKQVIPSAIGANYVDFALGVGRRGRDHEVSGGYVQWTDSGGNTQTRTILKTSGATG